MTEREHSDRERALDWLTAMVPLLIMSFIYYGWAALALILPAVAGYVVMAYLLAPTGAISRDWVPALTAGLLSAFFLPPTAPIWPAALMGGLTALTVAVPGLLGRRWPALAGAKIPFSPVLPGYLLLRLACPEAVDSYILPAQWDNLDGASTATPLAGLLSGTADLPLSRLFFGTHAAAMGEGCVLAILLGAAYLLLRRRLRLIAPATLLATVALLSWAVFGRPVYALLCGGVALGALLLADREHTAPAYGSQVAVGLVTGVLIVVLRRFAGVDGTAIALVVAGVLQPVYPRFFRLCGRVWRWVCPYLKGFGRFLARNFAKLLKKVKIKVDKRGKGIV